MKSRKPVNDPSTFSRPGRPPATSATRSKPVMSFPFDHLYACHSSDQSHVLRIGAPSTSAYRRISPATEKTLTERLNQCSKENRMLKNLLLVNLDLVQQQSDRIVTKEKALSALKKENATLKNKIERFSRRVTVPRTILNPPPLVPVHVPTSTQTSKSLSTLSTSQVTLNKYTELLITDNDNLESGNTTTIVDPNLNKSKSICYFPTEGEYLHLPEVNVAALLKDNSSESNEQKNYFYPKEDFTDFLNLTDLNSLLKVTESDLTKSKNCFFSTDDELLLPEIDVTSLDNEPDMSQNKAKSTGYGKGSADYLSTVPEVTAADRLKETLCRQLSMDSDAKGPVIIKKGPSKPRTGNTSTNQPTNRVSKNQKPPSQFYKSRNALPKRTETETSVEPTKPYESHFTVNKKSKMIHTYGKSSKSISSTERLPYTGSLSERLKLIDTTPTGEDPYQLGEADMREQSPIPKLMLQKSHTNKAKIFSGDNYTCTSETMKSLFDSSVIGENEDGKAIKRIKLNKYNVGTPYMFPGENDDEEDTDSDKNESEAAGADDKTQSDTTWAEFTRKVDNDVEASCCDFSYGENSRNLASSRINFENDDYQNLFSSTSSLCPSDVFNQDLSYFLNDDSPIEKEPKKQATSPNKKESSRSLLKPKLYGGSGTLTKYLPMKERMKRALSTCSSQNSKTSTGEYSSDTGAKNPEPPVNNKTLVGVRARPTKRRVSATVTSTVTSTVSTIVMAKKAPPTPPPPPAPKTADRAYFTTVGDAESSWYAGPEPDIDPEDNELPSTNAASESLEVPRWREKLYTSCYSLEGTENLDDEIFQKRHHKREMDEKRRKRWDMQRIREQLTVERLRRRQRDAPWYSGRAAPAAGRARAGSDAGGEQQLHSLWPAPQRDLLYIHIEDTIPYSAFGDIIPAVSVCDFVLPWIRNTRPVKKVKRSKVKSNVQDSCEKIML